MKDKKIIIYTDGACSGNPGPGGWGAVLIYSGLIKEIYGSNPNTTNNQMELVATIEAIKCLKKPCEIELFTDSAYVKNGMTTWIHSWKATNWKKGSVKNLYLWKELDELAAKHKIRWNWVKGHSGDKYNELADSLAIKGRDNAKGYVLND